jgi:hypothetical protein
MANTQILRSFTSSAAARAAGFSTLQWLRAFSFAEHAARADTSNQITEREIAA